MQNITVLAGGTSGARFSQLLLAAIRSGAADGRISVTLIANTAADAWLHGLKVSPDLDALMYALADDREPDSAEHGSRTVASELAAYGVGPAWFTPDDRDVATHLVRSQMLEAGYPLSQVTEALCRRWLTPAYGDSVRLLPMSDDRVETHVAVADAEAPSGRRTVHVLEYLHALGGQVPAEAVAAIGLDTAQPAPGVLDALTGADLILLAPGERLRGTTAIQGLPGVSHAVANAPRVEDLSDLDVEAAVAHALAALASDQ